MTIARLVLQDGTEFQGKSIGTEGTAVGEVVFNTAMTGYQEILTDPSYAGQIVTLTHPHIGNTGINLEDSESNKAQPKGLVIRSLSPITSSWRSRSTLPDYLKQQELVAISDIDTRHLTQILRDRGAQIGVIIAGEQTTSIDPPALLHQYGSMVGKDLVQEVSCKSPYAFNESLWSLTTGHLPPPEARYHVVAYDFGVKKNILRHLVTRACKVTVIPAITPIKEALALRPDGILLSNGPGDPSACGYAIATVQALLHTDIPILGICLGHQILALALGAKIKKMKFGHHGANHPVLDLQSKRVYITSQNHGFVVDECTLPESALLTHVSLFDRSLQGFRLKHKCVISFQGLPEAAPGPQDLSPLFDQFVSYLKKYRYTQ